MYMAEPTSCSPIFHRPHFMNSFMYNVTGMYYNYKANFISITSEIIVEIQRKIKICIDFCWHFVWVYLYVFMHDLHRNSIRLCISFKSPHIFSISVHLISVFFYNFSHSYLFLETYSTSFTLFHSVFYSFLCPLHLLTQYSNWMLLNFYESLHSSHGCYISAVAFFFLPSLNILIHVFLPLYWQYSIFQFFAMHI